jgi:hypothetical protein
LVVEGVHGLFRIEEIPIVIILEKFEVGANLELEFELFVAFLG